MSVADHVTTSVILEKPVTSSARFMLTSSWLSGCTANPLGGSIVLPEASGWAQNTERDRMDTVLSRHGITKDRG